MSQDFQEQPQQQEPPARAPEMSTDLAEVLHQATDIAALTQASVDRDQEQADLLQEDLGENVVDPTRGRMERLGDDVREEVATFSALAERLDKPYIISDELAKVVEVGSFLGKPILLEGEPGTGKTSLAYAIAGDEGIPIIHCRGKSTLTAESVMYQVDHVGRLNDAMLAQNIPDVLRGQTQQWIKYLESGGNPNSPEFQSFMVGFEQSAKLLNLEKVSDVKRYVKYGELGEAIIRAARGEKVVLLFDEIDKAKREFPNDLLDELEHLTIRIRETGEEVSAPRENVVVVITSNHERELPEPFLRRCVYSNIEFPDPDQMTAIVQSHIPDISEKLLASAVRRFYELRGRTDLQKKPSTSEMVDWIRTLQKFGVEEIGVDLPFAETLLKHKEDIQKVEPPKKKESRGSEIGLTFEEQLRQEHMPEAMIAALRGDRVIRLRNDYYPDRPQNSIYTPLANNGYVFTTAHTDRGRRPFTIECEGLEQFGDLTFAYSPSSDTSQEAAALFELLAQQDQIGNEFVVSEEPVTFTDIGESNKLFVTGTDTEGRFVYKLHGKNGRVVYEKPIVKENESEEE